MGRGDWRAIVLAVSAESDMADSSTHKVRKVRGLTHGQWVKNLPAVQETQETRVRSLGLADPLEEEMATHSSIQTEEPGGLQSKGSHRVGHD